MILSGQQVVSRGLMRKLRDETEQQQPCGVDLTLRQVSEWVSAARIDFDNRNRRAAAIRVLPYQDRESNITLPPGSYLVDFNESIKVPLDCMACLYPRSSLWRSGVTISAGVIDAGYEGSIGALLEVKNPHGVVLFKDCKLAQVVFEQMCEEVDGYKGIYQFSTESIGRDGTTAPATIQ